MIDASGREASGNRIGKLYLDLEAGEITAEGLWPNQEIELDKSNPKSEVVKIGFGMLTTAGSRGRTQTGKFLSVSPPPAQVSV